MKFSKFFKQSFLLFILCGLVLAGVFGVWGNSDARIAMVSGLLIAYGNALIGFAFICWGFRRSHKNFMISVFGNMILRFLLIFSLLFVLINAFLIDKIFLIISMFFSYFLFLALEIFLVHRTVEAERK